MTKTFSVRPEHKGTTQKSKKFEKKTGLFTGVSAAALMLGVSGGSAIGAGTTITKPTSSVVIGTKQQFDFLDIEAPVFNDVINNGTLAPGDSPTLVVDGPNGGSVGGNIINNNLISGTQTGIAIISTTKNTDVVGGTIINNGQINVSRSASTKIVILSSAFGIAVSGPAVATTITNNGNISVSLSATGIGHTAGGILVSSTGSLASNITNNGAINATGTALGLFIPTSNAQMAAFGVAATNSGAPGPATSNVVTNNPGGLISGAAFARASGPSAGATATALGVGQVGMGTSGTANAMTVSNATSATINAFASATVLSFITGGTAKALALGVGQSASGGLSITQNVNNSGNINVTASASAKGFGFFNANATAGGIGQTASGSPTIAQLVNNSGQINVKALATANTVTPGSSVNANASSATALGIGQFASGGSGTISNTLSITNSSQGSINVTASAFAAGTTSPDGQAFATGISQTASGGGSQSLTFTNQGALNVLANATASGVFATATGQANAVSQSVAATSGATSISLGITNAALANGTTTFTGSISASVNATARGTKATANASAFNQPVFYQSIGGAPVGSSATINLTNQGNIDADYSASATGTNVDASVNRVSGWWQDLNGSADNAMATVSNATGAIFSLNGTAFASGPGAGASGATADASVVGGWQTINGGLNASAIFNNNGTFNVAANATAQGQSPRAHAVIDTAVYQSVDATGGAGSTASALITNTSFLSANFSANANATGSTGASAVASILGFYQDITTGETVSVTLTNSGLVNMNASANAILTPSGVGDATAFATITTGVYQNAEASGGAMLSASANFTNSGDFNLTAKAFASATDSATASAFLSNGVNQDVSGADTVSATFTNSSTGNFNVNLTATAVGTDVFAKASNNTNIIGQSVKGGDDDVSASASIVNDGDISIVMNALAMGTNGTGGPGTKATASIELSYAIQQSVFDGANTTVMFVNNGTITFDLQALATNARDASASYDTFDTVFYLNASANGGADDTVTGIFTNAGLIDVDLNATANGVTDADAEADLNYFLLESVSDASVSSFTVTNSSTGVINLDIVANASATSGDASANAYLTSFMEISAFAFTGNQESATVDITNDGIISVNLTANAFGTDDATADISLNYGFYHIASGGDVSSVTFTNTNSITFDLNATALGTDASASVDFSYPFYFSANASDDEVSADVTFTNSSTGVITANINATAMGTNGTGGAGTSAFASAEFSTLFSSYAFDGEAVSITFTNDGTLGFFAVAQASNASDASASAEIDYGIYQIATAHGAPGGGDSATVSLTNNGNVTFSVFGQANGLTDADVDVEFDDTVIYQSADGAGSVSTTFTNTGNFTVSVIGQAFATAPGATGSADVSAEIDYPHYQYAFADDGTGNSALVDYTNSGTVSWLVQGTAVGVTDASVDAYMDTFLYQSATANPTASATGTASAAFTNTSTGLVDIKALAKATGGSEVDADASVSGYLIYQTVEAGGGQTASGSIVNDGTFNALVQATAFGTDGTGGPGTSGDASASFTSTLFYQTVDGAVNASGVITNNGDMNFTAIAVASNFSDASASAEIPYGFQQYVSATNTTAGSTAKATFTNTSSTSLDFTIIAQAFGVTDAYASAEFDDTIIYQTAEAETAEIEFTNTGAINILAQATAIAAGNGTKGDASADASIDYGFSQNAQANTGDGGRLLASSTFNNSVTINFLATAKASGTTQASATAYNDFGLYQFANNADQVVGDVNNQGSFQMSANAWAKGTDAYAFASTKTLISQSVDAGDDEVSSTGVINNSGVLSGAAQATAIGTDGSSGPGSSATATATIDRGINQFILDGNNSSGTINNAGTLSLSAIANALNASDVYAGAFMDYGIYQTVEADNSAGSSATATIINSSLTSFDITLSAKASGITSAVATASLSQEIVEQTIENAETASIVFDNSGAVNVDINAMATAAGNGTTGFAYANAYLRTGFEQDAQGDAGAQLSASASFNNSGIVDINLVASAAGTTFASAIANFTRTLVLQSARNADNVSVSFDNSGTLSASVDANASGAVDVNAFAYQNQASSPNSFNQIATGGDDQLTANISFVNQSGAAISLTADASAVGNPSATFAYASADFFQVIMEQRATNAASVSNLIQNDGTFSVLAHAFASNPNSNGGAGAYVELESGIALQSANANGNPGDTATNTLNNTSSLSLDYVGSATALGGISASAFATLEETYIFQGAYNAETASNTLTNTGSMLASLGAVARASGNGTTGNASALANIERGIIQSATAATGTSPSASNTLNNVVGPPSNVNGSIALLANAKAQGTTAASATASIQTPVMQYAQGSGQLTNFFNNNTGSVAFMASAVATGGTFASANALASRVYQTVNPSTSATAQTMTFHNRNSASFVVDANAIANNTGGGAQATAQATALGASQWNGNPGAQPVTKHVFENDDEDNFKDQPRTLFKVNAYAEATGGTTSNTASAYAEGFRIFSNTNTNAVLDITNGSNFKVSATAIGTVANATAWGMVLAGGSLAGTINNSGNFEVKASAPGGTASAVGFQLNSAINNTLFTNSGNISVLAIGSTTAVGVRYGTDTGHTLSATTADHATFINQGGTVWAQVNSGGTLDFGTAFDLSGAPNPVTLWFQGRNGKQGTIWGDILLSDDDNILVTNGMTYYAGMINGTATFNGSLTISSGGTLTLASTATGPATGYVDTFTNTSTGTLAFNVTPSTPSTGLGQINAITANLAGTVKLNIVPGLYSDTQTYQDVVVASTINGSFTSTDINTNTPLLNLTAVQPGDGTVDLTLTRVAFNAVPGLTINQQGAGSGLEGAYSTALTGDFGTLVQDLFTLDNSGYIAALEQLHGAEHVQNLRQTLWSMDLLNYALDERVNAGTYSNDLANDRGSVIRRGETTVWGKFMGRFGDLEGDVEASGYNLKEHGFYAGFDYSLTDDLLVGFAAGLYRNKLDFTNGSFKKDEGVQLSVYGAYDTQSYYVRANFGLGYYNVESMRNIDIVNTSGVAKGDYDVNVTSFHAEAGKRIAVGQSGFFTPFLGFNYVTAKQKAFSETGAAGANLGLPENKVKSFSSDLGARLSAAYSTGSNSVIVPEIFVKWRHEFKDEILSINSSFAGISGSGFNVISSHVDSDMFIAGAGVAFTQGDKVEVRLTYTGRFNSQIEDHSIGLRLSVLLGDRK